MAVYKNQEELMNTDWQGKINEAVAKGDMAAAAQYEQARNDKINSGNYAGKQTTTNKYSQYLDSGNKTSSNKVSSGTSTSGNKAAQDLNALAGSNPIIADMVAAAQKGDWDLVGSLSNNLGQERTYADGSTVIDMGYANDVLDMVADQYKYDKDAYYKGKYDSVYGEGAWDGAQQPVSKPTMDALESLLGGGYGGGASSAPEYEGSKWDSVLDSLAQQLLAMTYEDWTQGDQYAALAGRYGQQGKMSMQDVLGQMASRTGGLASSYATTAAQQQYNAYMSELENAAREMYGLEQDDLLEKAQLAQKYSQEDYDRYLDAWNQWNTNRNFEYDAWRDSVEDQRYTDAYTDKMAQQEKADLLDMAETMAAYGDFSGYKALGYTDDQIASLTSGYQAQLAAKSKSSGGGGSGGGKSMSLTTAKAMAKEGQFTDEVIARLKQEGFNDAYLKSEYGYANLEDLDTSEISNVQGGNVVKIEQANGAAAWMTWDAVAQKIENGEMRLIPGEDGKFTIAWAM